MRKPRWLPKIGDVRTAAYLDLQPLVGGRPLKVVGVKEDTGYESGFAVSATEERCQCCGRGGDSTGWVSANWFNPKFRAANG